jgi:DNA-binding LytR/AlgR family response regulator
MDKILQIAICEDFAADAEHLLYCIKQSSIETNCRLFSKGEDFLASFTAGRFDVIFMDIYMNGITGVEVVRRIRETDENTVIAFTTTSLDHTLDSYRLGVLKYIEKPATQKDTDETLEMALLKHKSAAYISLLADGIQKEIPLDSILYFEHQNHAVTVNLTYGVLRTSQTVKLKDIEAKLPSPPFLRCHHSYIANIKYVQSLDRELRTFTMKNGGKVYIRRQDLKKAAEAYENHLFQMARSDGQ